MITTVTLNNAIDKTYYMQNFNRGTVSRVNKMYAAPGGKGNNVAKVIKLLGGDVLATGFTGGANGEFIEKELGKLGIATKFAQIAGESRICLNIVDESDNISTEILEMGPHVLEENLSEIKTIVSKAAEQSSIVVLSGSLPPGCPSDFYMQLISIVKSQGALAFLDTSGEPLKLAVQSAPNLIKPNEDEFKQLTGKCWNNEDELVAAIMELVNKQIQFAVVSLGTEGSIAAFEGGCFRVETPQLAAVNPVGCGDSFIAGFAFGMERGESFERCLQLATAAGAANALTPFAGSIDLEDFQRLLRHIKVTKL